jgi:alkanesulfonate monooxygenase SsuD/methylene tetrahydromethanopterin reductase-like flavin-dependent oxidoreductase (luciferase family)
MSKSARLGIGFLGDMDPEVGPNEIVGLSKEAEDAGFETAWTVEYEYDTFAYDQAIALGTERILTGTAVTRYHTRHPMMCAQTAIAIDQMTPGRFIIGLGTGPSRRTSGTYADPRVGYQRWGLPADRAVARMREYIELVRLALTEEVINYEGEFYEMQNVKLRVRPKGEIPIYLAAGGDKMARLAGRLCDGFFFHLLNEAGTKHIIEVAHTAAEKAGRNPEDVRPATLVHCCVSEDRDAARLAMRAYLVDYYLHLPRYQEFLLAEGLDWIKEIQMLAPRGDTKAAATDILSDESMRKAAEAVPDSFLDERTIVGTPEECRKKLDELVGWGIADPVLYVFPAVDDNWTAGYRSAISAFGNAA